jgi:hypothetical protein
MPMGHGDTKFLVRWKGYSSDHDTWEPYHHLHPETIKEFLVTNHLYDHDWIYRCPYCDKPAASVAGVKIHCSRGRETTTPGTGKI